MSREEPTPSTADFPSPAATAGGGGTVAAGAGRTTDAAVGVAVVGHKSLPVGAASTTTAEEEKVRGVSSSSVDASREISPFASPAGAAAAAVPFPVASATDAGPGGATRGEPATRHGGRGVVAAPAVTKAFANAQQEPGEPSGRKTSRETSCNRRQAENAHVLYSN